MTGPHPEEPASLFVAVYGTLRAGERNHAHHLAGAIHVADAWLPGRLFEVAGPAYRFPAYVPGPDGRVEVEVYALPPATATADLAAIDELEGYDPGREDASPYVRRLRTLRGARPVGTAVASPTAAWVYEFTGATQGLRPVAGARWRGAG